ncbi:MAG: hypothetical protein WDM96_01750 [Lacunisphaera sp.]
MSEATFASSHVGAMPMELRRSGPTWRAMADLIRFASSSACARVEQGVELRGNLVDRLHLGPRHECGDHVLQPAVIIDVQPRAGPRR